MPVRHLRRLLIGDTLGSEVEEQHGPQAARIQIRNLHLQAVLAAMHNGQTWLRALVRPSRIRGHENDRSGT
jgi:hypothetical protein